MHRFDLRLADTAIIYVCKSVYAEACPLFHANNHFHYLLEVSFDRATQSPEIAAKITGRESRYCFHWEMRSEW